LPQLVSKDELEGAIRAFHEDTSTDSRCRSPCREGRDPGTRRLGRCTVSTTCRARKAVDSATDGTRRQ